MKESDDELIRASLLESESDFKLPFGPPPVLPDVTKQLKEYLTRPDRLPIHDFKGCQQFWPRKPDPTTLFHFEPSPLGTTLKVERDAKTGQLLQFNEVLVDSMGHTAKNSHSLDREPGALEDGIRGSSTNFPFFPGGFDEPLLDTLYQQQNSDIDFENELLEIPPEFEEGIHFHAGGMTPINRYMQSSGSLSAESASANLKPSDNSAIVNLMDFVEQERNLIGLWKDSNKDGDKVTAVKGVETLHSKVAQMNLEDEDVIPFLPDNIPVLNISESASTSRTRNLQWAEEIDVTQPVHDFHERIPNPALTFPFELDTFQKQAILKLEEHANVFVAAHTSAGKTVVAEYAIALSSKHMTRTIYTSPIKALSNQKFRDFKQTFKGVFNDVNTDVGLVTGDIQINQDASCLIMTTEILRSMLYCGSDLIRDLEYVIFDEVHYINDSERGHVWEEVLILLPQHVSIVMLSATVPNTLEFANWVGGTKKKKMYVISTLKRPVPLKHYLYTGFGGSTKNDRFLILDANGKSILKKGYEDAKVAKASKQTKMFHQRLTPKQETTLWVGFLDHLSAQDKLPVVAFTLSRNRCDSNAEALTSTDLTTAKQKRHIHNFFQQCINRLKETDKELPQAVRMQGLLTRGIGVHHSGILPILREIVEILFQEGHVKLLFATETFAMGVNMPARTVVFDSIRKYDGFEMRTLLPAEYIQMAGRAGRRGIDDNGTVVMLCKTDVPDLSDLEKMMLGRPEVLESQFRLTYSMILNLLRVDNISMEGMLSRSFKEVKHRTDMDKNKVACDNVEQELKQLTSAMTLSSQDNQMRDFYNMAAEFLDLWMETRMSILNQKRSLKDLVPGRVVLINHKHHMNKLGLVLSSEAKRDQTYRVLVLNDEQPRDESTVSGKSLTEEQPLSDTWYKMISFVRSNKIFVPSQVSGHCLLMVPPLDVFEVTTHVIKVDCSLVIKDCENRLIPRFRDNPPGKTCMEAIQELSKLTHSAVSYPQTLQFVDLTKDMALNDGEMINKVHRMSTLRRQLTQSPLTNSANFEENFQQVFKWKQLEQKRNVLKFLQSHENMSLYQEYKDRIDVLKRLNYIDVNGTIQLKGRVACNMGQNELIITELVFRNFLTGLQPAEIAALLSCLVFKQKTTAQPFIIESLKKGVDGITALADEIKEVEREFGIGQQEASRQFEGLNFGLIQVVYEWAKDKPFAEIMTLTDVQEGIIVRCMQQLNETLNDVRDAAHTIGDPKLGQMMEDASTAIKRDIVFAPSLYTI